ncbi:MAG TPA: XdhC/CoxI family protein [Saprospiraceae bacterium]|nr:XdhC/CoxI family protein [Saprospiraceae bacterium]
MKEIRDIIRSYKVLKSEGKQCALATVVHVEGSSYRRPGARMLIAEDGRLTGAISGGCLEGDAMRKALHVINEQVPALVTYDTMDEDDAKIGIGLGCNGIIKILIEPIDYETINHPIELLEKMTSSRQNAVIATFFTLQHKKQPSAGTLLFIDEKNKIFGKNIVDFQSDLIQIESQRVHKLGKNSWIDLEMNGEKMTAFLEFVPPAISLVIVGAGNDVLPMVEMADVLGWDTTVIDGRASYAKRERFVKACDVLIAKPEEVVKNIKIDNFTFFALMTHNYNYDKALLYELCQNSAKYIAMLGPKKKLERMLLEYSDEGRPLTEAQLATIHSPAGLDIGAETSEEIALSILAEIKAVIGKKDGRPLKDKMAGIHSD